jgi:Ni,Fe-hydrogenase III small subunit/NAD-dependent dihydropyrimidine dehydrogenase PreA subunit
MIFDVVKRSLTRPNVIIPVEDLFGNADGSRMPEVQAGSLTPSVAQAIVDACPTSALTLERSNKGYHLVLNYGECIGCGKCIEAGRGAVVLTKKFMRCGVDKKQLGRRFDVETASEILESEPQMTEAAREIGALLGRALNIREVDAGSCNGCEAEIVALTNPYYDLERFGIHFVASPKHADMLLVTGPVTRNMMEAVKQTYAATPDPKLVVAVGACGCGGGIFAGSHAVVGGIDAVIPVDAYIPGCPPTPAMLLSGILQALRRRA